MANTPKKLAQVELGTSDGSIGGPAAGKFWTISSIVVANTSGASRTFRLHHTGGSSTTGNALFYDASISANAVIEGLRGVVLESSQTLRGLASAASAVTVSVFGIESDN